MITLFSIIFLSVLFCSVRTDEKHPVLVGLNDVDRMFSTMISQQFERQTRAVEKHLAELKASFETNLTGINNQIQNALDGTESNFQNKESFVIAVGSDGSETVIQYVKIGSEPRVPAVIEQSRFGGGWLVVMQRYDGSVKFDRTWAEYRDGFGMLGHEFWFGLENMHQLTKEKNYELVVELEDFQGNSKYGQYGKIVIGSEEKRYALEELGEFNGTMGDSLTSHVGQGFSTFDNDSFGCSNKYANGGWWYYSGKCYGSSLTGVWKNERAWSSICWMKFSVEDSKTPLKVARMMIRPIKSD